MQETLTEASTGSVAAKAVNSMTGPSLHAKNNFARLCKLSLKPGLLKNRSQRTVRRGHDFSVCFPDIFFIVFSHKLLLDAIITKLSFCQVVVNI